MSRSDVKLTLLVVNLMVTALHKEPKNTELMQTLTLSLQMLNRNNYWDQFQPLYGQLLVDTLWNLLPLGGKVATRCEPMLAQCQKCYPDSPTVTQLRLYTSYQTGDKESVKHKLNALRATHPDHASNLLPLLYETPLPELGKPISTLAITEMIERHNWGAAIYAIQFCPIEYDAKVPTTLLHTIVPFIAQMAQPITILFLSYLPPEIRQTTWESLQTHASPPYSDEICTTATSVCNLSLDPRKKTCRQLAHATAELASYSLYQHDETAIDRWKTEMVKAISTITQSPRDKTSENDKGPIYDLLAHLQVTALALFDQYSKYKTPINVLGAKWCLALYDVLQKLFATQFPKSSNSPEILCMQAQILEDIPGKALDSKRRYKQVIALTKQPNAAIHQKARKTAEERVKKVAMDQLTPHWLT